MDVQASAPLVEKKVANEPCQAKERRESWVWLSTAGELKVAGVEVQG